MNQLEALLSPRDESDITFSKFLMVLFADDTTLFEEFCHSHLDSPEALDSNSVVIPEYLSVLSDSAMRENRDKRESGILAEMEVRNLGLNTNPRKGIRVKITKMWGAYHKINRKVAGAKISRKEKVQVIDMLVGAVALFGV